MINVGDILELAVTLTGGGISVTLTRAGQVVTATCTVGHNLVDGQVVMIVGATQTEYNGAVTVTVVSSKVFTYVITGTPVMPATGTITVLNLTYVWAFWDNTTIATKLPRVQKLVNRGGVLSFSVTATDALAQVDTASDTITVNEPPTISALTVSVNDQPAGYTTVVTVTWADPDYTAGNVTLALTDESSQLVAAGSGVTTFSGIIVPADEILTLTITDPDGGVTTMDIDLRVVDAPLVNLVGGVEPRAQRIGTGQDVQFKAMATHATDAVITQIRWTFTTGGGWAANDTQNVVPSLVAGTTTYHASLTKDVSGETPGVKSVVVRATASDGAFKDVTVSLRLVANASPVIDQFEFPTIVLNEATDLAVIATDVDGDPLTHTWSITRPITSIVTTGTNTVMTSIVAAGGVATAVVTAHGLVTGQQVAVAGADQVEYNGAHVVTVINAATFTFPVAGSPAAATGTLNLIVLTGAVACVDHNVPLRRDITISGAEVDAYNNDVIRVDTATDPDSLTADVVPSPVSVTSITRSGSTATVTATHGLVVDQHVVIGGADQTEYGGDHIVLSVPTADTFTYTVSGTPATPATGVISMVPVPVDEGGANTVLATTHIGNPVTILPSTAVITGSLTVADPLGGTTTRAIPAILITGDLAITGVVGQAFTHVIVAMGTGTITYSVTGTLPAGLQLVGDTIQGIPQAEGLTTVTLVAENAAGVAQQELEITITGVAVAPPPPTNLRVFSMNFNAFYTTGQDIPVRWTVTRDLLVTLSSTVLEFRTVADVLKLTVTVAAGLDTYTLANSVLVSQFGEEPTAFLVRAYAKRDGSLSTSYQEIKVNKA